MKKLLIGLIVLMVAMPLAYAGTGKLLISDLDVEVDGKWDRGIDDGDEISREAEPGVTVSFKIEFFNNYTDAEDLDIEDVSATVTIEEIDDGDDIDEESKEFDVRADDDKSVTVDFELPVEIEEDTFSVTIEAEGEDENGTDQSVFWTVDLVVEKENHELRLFRKTLNPTQVSCGGLPTLSLGVINTGQEDEEDVEILIENFDLEIAELVTVEEISEGAYDDDVKYSSNFRIEIPDGADPGIYPIDIKVTYDDGDETLQDSVDLIIDECIVEEEEELECMEDSDCDADEVCEDNMCVESEEDVVVVTQPPTTQPPTVTPPVITPPTTTEPTETAEEESFFDSGWFIGLLIAAEIIIILIAILLVIALVRRKSA